jgi:ATP-dependent DNA helicase RecG
MPSFLKTKIEYLPGVGPSKAILLQQELQLHTFEDLIQYYPFRYKDRSQLYTIKELATGMSYVQLRGTISHVKTIRPEKKRLLAYFQDKTGEVALVWFKGLQWILKKIRPGVVYTLFGKPTVYGQQISFIHPELEVFTSTQDDHCCLFPVYCTTEKLKAKYIDSNALAMLQRNILEKSVNHIPETLPDQLRQQYKLMDRSSALLNIHFPKDHVRLSQAQRRLKFEELFYLQLQLLQLKQIRMQRQQGKVFCAVHLLQRFYTHSLPFPLTGAQKRVVKEIYHDLRSGYQMNRLVQGDVGSGKTMVAFLSMLICIGSGAQVAMMAPTELLAEQHYQSLQAFAEPMHITIALLTGDTKKKQRDAILDSLQVGTLQILVGTHALLNATVKFKALGLAVIDEQHRFGVIQRAQLWTKISTYFPHVLVMTATPIPRTLAMTFYGDLDISVMDEMPAGRRPIKTVHYYDAQRIKVFQFLKDQMATARQVYIVYPLIEASKTLDYKNLLDGYESICRAFPEVPISMIHGQMRAVDKAYEMQRFVKRETLLMVSTTVIEVGVNVPNATVMVIENAERFGLSQLHQLRGRVGRGSAQAYCILMTGDHLNSKSRERIHTMVRTNDGFEIADVDLRLRGPGDLLGVQQSGALDFKIADLAQDGKILQAARAVAQQLMQEDAALRQPHNLPIKVQLERIRSNKIHWRSMS